MKGNINPKRLHLQQSSDRRIAAGYRPSKYLKSQHAISAPKQSDSQRSAELVPWEPSHFRLFIGNLGPEVTEESLITAFASYRSVSKVSVPKAVKKDEVESKGYGFVSFASADDYLKCYREMNNKYIGSRPITLQRAKGEISTKKAKSPKHKHKSKRKAEKGPLV